MPDQVADITGLPIRGEARRIARSKIYEEGILCFMGFDITFHPISPAEFQQFFAEVIDKTKFVERYQHLRVSSGKKRYEEATRILSYELTPHQKKFNYLHRIYCYQFPRWRKDVQEKRKSFEATLGSAAAIIAGFLHPYWYAHGTGISGLCIKKPFFSSFLESMTALAPEHFKDLKDTSDGIITMNYQGGGYIDHAKLAALEEAITGQYATLAVEVLGDSGREALLCAIRYAQQTGTGLLEASGVIASSGGEYPTDSDNMRAAHLKNLDDFSNMRERMCRTLEEALQHRETVTVLNLGRFEGNDQPEPLPETLGELTRLRELIIYPGFQVSSLPASIGRLRQLEKIIINHAYYPTHTNHLSILPPEISKLTSLRVLTLPNNRLKQLPAEIGQLPNLVVLNLSGNALTTLPETIGDLPELMYFDVSKNNLEELPESIGKLARLYELKANDNQLHALPENIGMAGRLSLIQLNNNQLTTLPASFSNLSVGQLKGNLFSRAEKMRLNKLFSKKLHFS